MPRPAADESYDYIVVGAGSAGCAVAARLAGRGHSVLLLEAGEWDTHWSVRLPFGYYRAIASRTLNWNFSTDPEDELAKRRIAWPRGRVVGGSSSINGLVYIRGQAKDYDDWASSGGVGWAWEDVLPYFQRLERFCGEESAGRGRDGPVCVTPLSAPDRLTSLFIQSCESLGWRRNDGFNGPRQDGVGLFELTTNRGLRASAARAFIHPLRRDRNLRVVTGALCDTVLLEGRRAVGVAYLRGGSTSRAHARREVVLCCGAIGSPAVLLRSGIGSSEAGAVAVSGAIHRLPGVGLNVQDHFQARAVHRLGGRQGLNGRLLDPLWMMRTLAMFLARRNGPLAVGAGEAGLFASSAGGMERPDLQVHFLPFSTDAPGQRLHPWPGITMSVCQLRPESRGTLRLLSPDPMVPPVIRANYLSAEADREAIVAGLRLLRRIAATAPLSAVIADEVEPGADAVTDAALLEFARRRGGSIFHPCGGCRMGSGALSVVDPHLRVRGLASLRVADASIMPTIISGNINAASLMIGERAADFLMQD